MGAYVFMFLNGFLCYGLDFSFSGACVLVYIYVHIEKVFGFVDSIIGLIDFYEHRMP